MENRSNKKTFSQVLKQINADDVVFSLGGNFFWLFFFCYVSIMSVVLMFLLDFYLVVYTDA